jgi:hypothetical protein
VEIGDPGGADVDRGLGGLHALVQAASANASANNPANAARIISMRAPAARPGSGDARDRDPERGHIYQRRERACPSGECTIRKQANAMRQGYSVGAAISWERLPLSATFGMTALITRNVRISR